MPSPRKGINPLRQRKLAAKERQRQKSPRAPRFLQLKPVDFASMRVRALEKGIDPNEIGEVEKFISHRRKIAEYSHTIVHEPLTRRQVSDVGTFCWHFLLAKKRAPTPKEIISVFPYMRARPYMGMHG